MEVRGVKREQEYDFLEPRPDTIESEDSNVSRRCLRIWEYLLRNEARLQRAGLVYYDGAHVIYSLVDFFAGTQQVCIAEKTQFMKKVLSAIVATQLIKSKCSLILIQFECEMRFASQKTSYF